MPLLLKLSWIIPFAPFLGGFLVLILLISFNRTMNRLSKPVSYLLIVSVGVSTILSFLLYSNNLSGQVYNWEFTLSNAELHLGFYVDSVSTLTSTCFGLFILMIMITSLYLRERKKGYVAYFVFLGLACGAIFSFILSGELFHRLV